MKYVGTFGCVVAFTVLLVFFTTVLTNRAQSGSANSPPLEVRHSDGTPIKLYVHGDVEDRWYADVNGFTVIEVPSRYVYALRDAQGRLAPTNLLVGNVKPKECGLQKRILPTREVIDEIRRKALPDQPNAQTAGPTAGPVTTTPHLVEVAQADGSKIKLRFHGDAKFHWYADVDDFTVVHIAASYVYALRDSQGKLTATDLLVGKVDPKECGLQKGILPKR